MVDCLIDLLFEPLPELLVHTAQLVAYQYTTTTGHYTTNVEKKQSRFLLTQTYFYSAPQ